MKHLTLAALALCCALAACSSDDLEISSSVLEYVPALAASLALCARLLKPGGVLIVSLPSGLSVNRAYQRLKYRLTGQPREYGYIRHYLSEGKFRRLAAPLGLTVERVAYYGHHAKVARLSRALRLPAPLAADLFVAVCRRQK